MLSQKTVLHKEQRVIQKGNMDHQDEVQGQKQPHSLDSGPPVQVCSAAAKDSSPLTLACDVLPQLTSTCLTPTRN